MKRLALPLAIGLLALSGCAHQYVLKMGNGQSIVTANKPKLKDGVYYFKDARGQQHAIASSRITEMEPASMARQEMKAASGGQSPPKKRHWYFLWLA